MNRCSLFPQIRSEPGAGQFADGGGAGAVDAAGAAPRPVAAPLAGRTRRVHRGRQRAVRCVHRRGPSLGGALAPPLLVARHKAARPLPARRRLGHGAAAGGVAARHRRRTTVAAFPTGAALFHLDANKFITHATQSFSSYKHAVNSLLEILKSDTFIICISVKIKML